MHRVDIESPSNTDDLALDHSDFASAPDAFKTFVDETILYALRKDYARSMNTLQAFVDAFCDDGAFSWQKTAKISGALSIGAFASIFVASASGAAATTLQNAFKQQTGIDISYGQIIVRLFQVANTGGSAMLATFTGMNLIEAYLGHVSDAEKYLKYEAGTCEETSKKISRKVFDLFCAIASSVPTYFLTQSAGVPLAVCTAIANTSITWFGVSSLPLTPVRIHPARRIERSYINGQLETFLKLSPNQQNAIINEIEVIRSQNIGDQTYKQVYARLLNLAKPVSSTAQTTIDDTIQEIHARTCRQKSFAVALGLYLISSQITFTEASGVGIARLFPDPTSAVSITSSVIAAAFSVLPNVGMGYSTGSNAAFAMTDNNIPLAKLFLAKTRDALKYTIDIIALFAGGTSFTVAINAANDLINTAQLQGILEKCLLIFTGTVSYSTGAIINAYYMLRLCDDILIYVAQRCGDENIRRLFTFVMEARRLNNVLGEITEENYLELLRWKMAGNTELSTLLHHIFDNNMSDTEYSKTQDAVNKNNMIMRNRPSQRQYQLTESFVHETPEWQVNHPGLRRRKCCLFSANDAEDKNVTTVDNKPIRSIVI